MHPLARSCAAAAAQPWQHCRSWTSTRSSPQLLDPHLEGIVTPLAGLLRAEATARSANLESAHSVSRLLWLAATVR